MHRYTIYIYVYIVFKTPHGKQKNSPPKTSMPFSLEPLNKTPCVAKVTLQIQL